jgi:hypothetical protein
MPSNVLEFALALQSNSFLQKIGVAEGGVLSLASAFGLMEKAGERAWEAIGTGAELQGLASRTNETVSQLYRFQQGLMAIGSPAENVQILMLMTQKALSGVNDQGFRTDILFSRIGLNMAELRRTDTISAIQKISQALSHLSPNQASGVAESLFGRFNAGTILGLANNVETFKRAFTLSAETGALLDKFGKTFENVKLDWQIVANDMLGIWVGVAGRLVPALHEAAQEAHKIAHTIEAAFADGKVTELLKLSLEVGAEYGASFLGHLLGDSNLWKGIAETMGGNFLIQIAAIENGFIMLGVTIETMFDTLFQNVAQNFVDRMIKDTFIIGQAISAVDPALGKAVELGAGAAAVEAAKHSGTGNFQDDWRKNYDATDKGLGALGPGGLLKSGLQNLATGAGDIGTAIMDAGKNATSPQAKALLNLLNALSRDLGFGSNSAGKDTNDLDLFDVHHRTDFTSLEKMGFHFNNGGRVRTLQEDMLGVMKEIRKNTDPKNLPDSPHHSYHMAFQSNLFSPGNAL